MNAADIGPFSYRTRIEEAWGMLHQLREEDAPGIVERVMADHPWVMGFLHYKPGWHREVELWRRFKALGGHIRTWHQFMVALELQGRVVFDNGPDFLFMRISASAWLKKVVSMKEARVDPW